MRTMYFLMFFVILCHIFRIEYKLGSEAKVATATTEEQIANDAVPAVYLGQEVLTKHSTLQANGECIHACTYTHSNLFVYINTQ